MVVQTRDEYFEGQSAYRKPGYANKGNYRKSVVIDKNNNDDLAVVKLTTKGRFPLPEYKTGKSRYNPQIQTLDDEGKSIQLGPKFVPTSIKNDMSPKCVNMIKRQCLFGQNSYVTNNWIKIHELKKND